MHLVDVLDAGADGLVFSSSLDPHRAVHEMQAFAEQVLSYLRRR